MVETLVVIAIIGLLAAILLPAMTTTARADVYQPNFYRQDTNATPFTLTNGGAATFAANSTNSYEQVVKQNNGLSVFVQVISSNSLAGNGTLGWDVTPDGSTYTTTEPLKFTFPQANTSNNVAQVSGLLATNLYWTNWPASTLNNVRDIQLTTATNALVGGGPTTNSCTYKVWYSYSNQ